MRVNSQQLSLLRVVLRTAYVGEKPKEGDFNADNFAWPAEGHADAKPHTDGSHPATADGNASGKFSRYPSLGSPNQGVAASMYYFNIG